MKKVLIIICGLFIYNASFSQGGKVMESLSIDSKILGKKVEYSIYLPADYYHSERKYPTLYLLHGYTDDETGWTQFGEVKKIADQSINDDDATQMIIAMPDAGVDWYINSYDGKTKYEDFFIQEFIPFIEEKYKARKAKEFRAVAGLSMGGFGTLIYAMKHSDMFAAAAPLSAAVWDKEYLATVEGENWNPWFGFIYGETEPGDQRLTDHLKSNTPVYLVESIDPQKLKSVSWYIDCGDDDFLINGNMALHRKMKELDIPHEFRVRDGAHNWTYWRTALPEVLKFVSQKFHR